MAYLNVSKILLGLFLFLGLALPSLVLAASELPQSFTLDGQLTQTGNDLPLLDSNLKITIQILDPSKTCLLYEETHQPVDTTASNGYYNLRVGTTTGSPKRTVNDPGLTMVQIFQNRTAVTASNAPLQTCADSTYTPAAGHARYFRLIVTPSATNVADTLAPDTVMDSVPNALIAERAESLQGYVPAHFLRTNIVGVQVLDQTNIESIFNTTSFPRLTTLLSVAPTSYVQTGANGSAGLPLVATGTGNPASGLTAGQIWYDDTNDVLKYYDGTVKTVGTSAGITSVGLTLPAMFTVTGSPLTSNGSISATLANQAQNSVFAGPATGGAGAPTFRALASSDLPLTGTTGAYVNGGNSFGSAASVGTNDNNTFALKTNGTDKMTVLANGNVGIGTTSPSSNLHVAAAVSAAVTINATSSGSTSASLIFKHDNGGTPYSGSIVSSWWGYGMTFTTPRDITQGGFHFTGQNGTEAMHIDTATSGVAVGSSYANTTTSAPANGLIVQGNVGIGTTTPDAKLHIQGAIGSYGPGQTGNAGLVTSVGTSTDAGLYGVTIASGGKGAASNLGWFSNIIGTNIYYDSTTDSLKRFATMGGFDDTMGISTSSEAARTGGNRMSFYTSANSDPVERMSITTTGNVGVGTTAPSANLDVYGTTKFSTDAFSYVSVTPGGGNGNVSVIKQSTNSPRNGGDLAIQVDASNQGGNFMINTNGANERLRVTTAGNVGIGTTTPDAKLHIQGAIGSYGPGQTGNAGLVTSVGTSTDAGLYGVTIASGGKGAASNLGWFSNIIGTNIYYDSTTDSLKRFATMGGFDDTMGISTSSEAARTGGNRMSFYTSANSDPVERMSITTTGNVGIGTTSPQSTLQVNGYVQLALTTGAPPAADCDAAAEYGRMKVDASAGVNRLYICTADGWIFK